MRVSLALLLGFCIILLGEADEGERLEFLPPPE